MPSPVGAVARHLIVFTANHPSSSLPAAGLICPGAPQAAEWTASASAEKPSAAGVAAGGAESHDDKAGVFCEPQLLCMIAR